MSAGGVCLVRWRLYYLLSIRINKMLWSVYSFQCKKWLQFKHFRLRFSVYSYKLGMSIFALRDVLYMPDRGVCLGSVWVIQQVWAHNRPVGRTKFKLTQLIMFREYEEDQFEF